MPYDKFWDGPEATPDGWKQQAIERERADRAARERAAEASLQRERELRQREQRERERNGFYDRLDSRLDSRGFVVRTDHLAREIDRRNSADPSRSDEQIKTQLCKEYSEGRLDRAVSDQLVREGHVARFEAAQQVERQRAIDEINRRSDEGHDRHRGDDLERAR